MTARYTRGILAFAGLFIGASLLQAQTLQITTDSLPPATVGASYNQQLVTTGGVCSSNGTASSTIDAGALPPGLSITSPASTKQWFLQGTPSGGGNFFFTVHLTWTYNRVNPADNNCVDDAFRSFTLNVPGNPNPNPNQTLAVDRAQITVGYRIPHFPPGGDTVRVTSTGGAAVIAAQSVTDSGGPYWLSVTPQGATTPAALTISYSVSGLAEGTYTGRVTVTIAGTLAALTIPVTLVVSTDSSSVLQSDPSSLGFFAVVGGPDPPPQSVRTTVSGITVSRDNVIFQSMVSTDPPNARWLSIAATSAATPATLTVAVTAKGLPAGLYRGVLTMAVGGIPNGSIPVTFTIQASAEKPTITAGGVKDAAGSGPAIAPGTWVSVYGTALSATERPWRDVDFQNGRLPTSLDGVSVTINGKSAAVAFISPTQINVLAADDTATGLVPVVVKNTLGTSDGVLALQQTAAPALFQHSNATAAYAVGVHADGSNLAGPALVQQGIPGTAAHVGETIVLFGTGFGATQPAISATDPVPAALPLAHPEEFSLRIGGLDAAIAFAGLVSPGVYQFNVVVPQVAVGDQPVVAELHGLLTQSALLLTIQK